MQINSKSKYNSLFMIFPEFHELKPICNFNINYIHKNFYMLIYYSFLNFSSSSWIC